MVLAWRAITSEFEVKTELTNQIELFSSYRFDEKMAEPPRHVQETTRGGEKNQRGSRHQEENLRIL